MLATSDPWKGIGCGPYVVFDKEKPGDAQKKRSPPPFAFVFGVLFLCRRHSSLRENKSNSGEKLVEKRACLARW